MENTQADGMRTENQVISVEAKPDTQCYNAGTEEIQGFTQKLVNHLLLH